MEEFKGKSPHKPFSSDTDIRVMTLLPNREFDAPIECQLEHVTLQPGVNYEAISYAWGDPKITEPIQLDGQSYPVTVNIFTAFKYLRLEESPRKLWVDSICINQKDNDERSHQIPKMRDIYKLASQVLVWIGDYQPYTQRHIRGLFNFMIKMVNSRKYRKEAETIADMGFDEMWRSQEEIHEFLTSRHWFQRMWIIQEVSVRKRLCIENLHETPILICGHLQLPLFYLTMSQNLWSRPRLGSQLGLPRFCPTLRDLSLIWDNYQEDIEYSPSRLADRQLAAILSLAAELFHTTDKRDFIYSVLGLLVTEEIPSPLRPNYDKSPGQVLIESATYLIQSGNIDVIQFNSMKSNDLPSWTPDWRHKAPIPINARFPFTYDAHAKILDKLVLEVDILTFTSIEAIGPRLDIPSGTMDSTHIWTEFFLDAEDSLKCQTRQVHTHRSFGLELSQLLLFFDMRARLVEDGGWHMCALHNEPLFFSAARGPGHGGFKPSNALDRVFESEMWKSVGETIRDKYLFRCKDSSIGIIGQPHIVPHKGDLICTIKGACGEFVLRPWRDGYKLIGICQRTVKCFQTKFGNIDPERWAGSLHILDDLVPLWKSSDIRRSRIY
ncbi:heterokaryon incompatibility protein-domain-containing protein [Camillea tinctor]|nr:heterokaryon incompatibility protein-domain-containing protein [Camillea tinctor]